MAPVVLFAAACAGCQSPFYADRGALFGGLTGAGVGAAIGSASGKTGEGAVIGTAVGALTGAAVGSSLDEINAQNQALIEQRLGRRMVGAATINDTIAMTKAGLGDDVIITHLRTNGLAGVLTASDLIALKQAGVSDRVLQAMQESTAVPPPVAMPVAQPPVIVQEHYYARPWPEPCYRPHPWHYRHAHRPPSWSWGFSYQR